MNFGFRISDFGFARRVTLWLFLLSAVCCLPSAVSAQDTPLTNKFPTAPNSQDSLGRTADGPSGTLTSTINSSVTTFGITGAASSFPASGLSLLIENEIILCTARVSATFSGCLRGQKGTTAASHTAGVAIRSPILTAQRDVLKDDLIAIETKLGIGSSVPADDKVYVGNGPGSAGWESQPTINCVNCTLNATNLLSGTIPGTRFPSVLPAVSGASLTDIVTSFMTRNGAITLVSSDLNGLSGAGLSGIGSGTGGVINTGTTTIGGDSDANGVGVVALQTRNLTRLQIDNDGAVELTRGSGSGTGQGAAIRLNTFGLSSLIELSTADFAFTNGPAGEVNYTDQTFGLGYNSISGTKQVAGLVNFSLNHESKFRNGTAGVGPSNFQTEIYYTWTDPGGTISIRPWGMNIAHASGDVEMAMQGNLNFIRNNSNGGTTWARWTEDGALDLSFLSTGAIVFKNNIGGLKWKNAAGDNTLSPIYVDSSNVTRLGVGGGGSDVVVDANNFTASTIKAAALLHSSTPTTGIRFDFSNQMELYANNNAIASLTGNYFQMLKALIFSVDNTIDIGKTGGTPFRPANVYVGTLVETPALNITSGGSTTISTGAGSVKTSTANPANNTVWIPIKYAGTTYYVPGWTTNAP